MVTLCSAEIQVVSFVDPPYFTVPIQAPLLPCACAASAPTAQYLPAPGGRRGSTAFGRGGATHSVPKTSSASRRYLSLGRTLLACNEARVKPLQYACIFVSSPPTKTRRYTAGPSVATSVACRACSHFFPGPSRNFQHHPAALTAHPLIAMGKKNFRVSARRPIGSHQSLLNLSLKS